MTRLELPVARRFARSQEISHSTRPSWVLTLGKSSAQPVRRAGRSSSSPMTSTKPRWLVFSTISERYSRVCRSMMPPWLVCTLSLLDDVVAVKPPALGNEGLTVQPIGAVGDRHEVLDHGLREVDGGTVNHAVRHRAAHDTHREGDELVGVVGDGERHCFPPWLVVPTLHDEPVGCKRSRECLAI